MKKSISFYILALLLMAVLFALNLIVGSVRIPVHDVFSILSGGASDLMKEHPSWRFIVIETRLPQAITAMFCGAALGVSGLLLQTAFRNPLAGPSIFGITNGAGLGVAIVMLYLGGSISSELFSVNGFVAILVSAFVGAMLITSIIFFFSTIVRNNVMLLIIGIMVGYLSSSAISLLNFFATEEGVRSYLMWGMGTFGAVSLNHIPLFSISIVVGLLAAVMLIKPLNALLLGEQYAENLGVSTRSVRNWLLVITGVLTAVCTAYCGPIAFLGLAVPHIARLLLSSENHRQLLPATIITGALVALLCNLVCHIPGESGIIPLNAVTPLIGAPIVIYVILKKSSVY